MTLGKSAFTAFAVFLGLTAHAVADEQSDALAAEARGIIAQFAEKLKSELTGAIKVDGPLKAIEVCHVAAPAIAADSSAGGWVVGRTALKLRNPNNAPDEWERSVLEDFDAARSKGADVTKLQRVQIVEKDGARTFRFMKAIPVAEMCLTCHGEVIKEPVREKLTELYPQDRATGYKEGDIRGAFTLSRPMQ
ncbi:DUF3365 domain-containing protein [Rhodomicrobium sp. Az07]|uniref:Tll0287-like domain-containing protein n=1 Tax=Rhodomicrobium sp. Az07 TaxID=2839034 RepID=UPI001BE7B3C9|nr:DUF3365 domain-containing protein [Rhodomicrobium sp. Az07]MBT3071568.1 DUF3365 domain-containing protein [Rhodomicrobium sp. Az07]